MISNAFLGPHMRGVCCTAACAAASVSGHESLLSMSGPLAASAAAEQAMLVHGLGNRIEFTQTNGDRCPRRGRRVRRPRAHFPPQAPREPRCVAEPRDEVLPLLPLLPALPLRLHQAAS